jgi:hypothetical protein
VANPKIVYNSVTLNFSYPPRQVPNYDKETVRHINVASSGKVEQVYERTDAFLEIAVEDIPDPDAAAWSAFLDWANQGLTFNYYPDASAPGFTTYTLETLKVKLAWKSPGLWTVGTLKFRTVV